MVYIIVLWHLLSYTGAFSFVPYGGEYITSVFLGLFFIISGYLLKSKYDITGRAALKKYLTRRVLRIMPIYAVALASFVMVAMCTPREALFAFLGLSSFIPPQPMTLWFVSMILFFYVCFLVSGLRCKYVVWTAIYALIIVASHFYDGIDPRLILYFPCFIFGIPLQKIGRTEQLTKGGGNSVRPVGLGAAAYRIPGSGTRPPADNLSGNLRLRPAALSFRKGGPDKGGECGGRFYRLLLFGRLHVPSPANDGFHPFLLAREQ